MVKKYMLFVLGWIGGGFSVCGMVCVAIIFCVCVSSNYLILSICLMAAFTICYMLCMLTTGVAIVWVLRMYGLRVGLEADD